MYKIYVPEELTFFYADEFGDRYDAPSDDVVEQPLTEAQALSAVRALRNQRLFDCDWTQLPDAPLSESQRARWRSYRQELRDMMDDFEWDLTRWPEP